MRRARQFFTLIELLVVVTIISILASLLLPALNRARESAFQALCTSHMRQISLAVFDFTEDYNGYLPHGKYGDWKHADYRDDMFPPVGKVGGTLRSWSNAPSTNMFWPYYSQLGEVLCPRNPQVTTFKKYWAANVRNRSQWWRASGTYTMAAGQFSVSYKNGNGNTYTTKARLHKVVKPAELISFLEQRGYPSTGRQYYEQRYYNQNSYVRVARHHNDRGSNGLFFDGHVEYYNLEREIDWFKDYSDGCIQGMGFVKSNWRNE